MILFFSRGWSLSLSGRSVIQVLERHSCGEQFNSKCLLKLLSLSFNRDVLAEQCVLGKYYLPGGRRQWGEQKVFGCDKFKARFNCCGALSG